MRKLKLFMTALALVGGMNVALAQTDVTSTYITNADFETSPTFDGSSLGASGTNATPTTGSTLLSGAVNVYEVSGWTLMTTEKSDFARTFTMPYNTTLYVKSNGSNGGQAVAAPSNGSSVTESNSNLLFVEANWCNQALLGVKQVATLPAGVYTLTFDSYISTNLNYGTSRCGVSYGSTTNYKWPSTLDTWTNNQIDFTLSEETEVTFSFGYLKNSNQGGGNSPFLFVDNVKLKSVPYATAEDYSALNTAISTVEAITWGFDAGEYAPYNYTEIIDALAAAKAINQDTNNSQVTIQTLTATLNTSMTANAAEVNAIFDGSFEHDYSGQTGNINPIGWQRVKDAAPDGYNVRLMNGSNTGLAATTSGKAIFTKQSAYYGYATGYTMPLNAETYYTISFIYGGWGDCKKDGYVSMSDPNGTAVTLSTTDLPVDATNADTEVNAWKSYSSFFKTGNEGNYVLGLRKKSYDTSGQSQYVYGDIVLKKTTVAEALAYYNTVKAEVEGDYDADANGGSEKADFKDALDASLSTVAEIMEAAANLYTLRDAFVAATPKYDLYVAEKANAERIDASITSSVSAPNTATEAEAAWKTILVNEYNYVEDNFNADAAEAYGITIDQWTGTATSGGNSDTPQTNSNEKWGTSATTYYEQGSNGWGSNSWTLNYTKRVTLPKGTYVLKIAARASDGTTAMLKATIGDNTVTEALPNFSSVGKGITTSGVASFDEGEFAKDGKGFGWQWRYLAFTLDNEGEVTLQIDASANSINQWCSFGDVAVVSNVTTDALETAYNNFTMQPLGFEEGQYAPYNNVSVLEAYAEAKAIVEGTKEPSTQSAVDALTATLTSPTWTANASDVDAIYNGNFSSDVEGDWGLTGWTRSNGWGQQQTNVSGDYSTAYYNQPGSLKYGETGVYTMPLAANTAYRLTFAYRSHENNSNNGVTASVLNGEKGLAAPKFEANGSTSEWKVATKVFKTGAAGNYVLTLANDGNTWMTGVSLVKAVAEEVTIEEGATDAPAETYANVKLIRKLVANIWNTFSVPFDMEIPGNWTVKEFDSATDNTLNFSAATSIQAGVPYLVKTEADVVNPTFEGVTVEATEGETIGEGDYQFAAQIYNKELATDGTIAYLATDGTIKKLNSANGLKGLRAYFIIPASSAGARIAFIDDGGTTTGIESMASGVQKVENGVYDLQGRRVEAMKKGLYIVNGKKVVK